MMEKEPYSLKEQLIDRWQLFRDFLYRLKNPIKGYYHNSFRTRSGEQANHRLMAYRLTKRLAKFEKERQRD